MFSQVPKKLAGQLAQYSPVAALTMIVGHGTDAAFAAQAEPTDSTGPAGSDALGNSRLASLTSGGSCADPVLAARPALAPSAPPPQVIHEVIKQVPVPVPAPTPAPGEPTRIVVEPERHEYYHSTKITNIDNHPTSVSTTVNQAITAGGDVNTSVNTNTVSGKGALGVTESSGAEGGTPASEPDDDFGAGAKPAGNDADTANRGDGGDGGGPTPGGTTEGEKPTTVGPAAGEDGGLSPASAPGEPVQPQPELHEGPPSGPDDPDGPLEGPEDQLAKTVHGGGGDPLAPDLVGGPAGEPLPHEPPPPDAAHGDLLGHTLEGGGQHPGPAADADAGEHDELMI